MTIFQYARPENMGVPSNRIYNFIKKLESNNIPMHSMLISRHGNLITEAYYAPYERDTLHRMFSISKSFTSIAIGHLISLGKLSLSDKIIQFFPEMLPEVLHPYIAEMTIYDMLTMQTCYSTTTYKDHPESNWVKSFFTSRPTHPSGSSFNYDTSSSHTLCALVEKLTSMPMLDFLRHSFLDQIGFSKNAYIIKDPFGVSQGGSGLMATPRDMMLFATLLLDHGRLLDQQLLSEEYIKDAIAYHSDTLINGPTLEEQQGYGYMFWRIRNNGFACYGMGGQLIICLPDQDLIVVTTADTQGLQGGNQLIYNCLYDELLPYLSDDPLPVNVNDDKLLKDYISQLAIQPLRGNVKSPLTKILNQQHFRLESNPSGFTHLSLAFDEPSDLKDAVTVGSLTFTKDHISYTLPFGFDHLLTSQFPIYNQTCVTSGVWLKPDTLYIKSHLIDECIGSIYFHLTFKNDTLTLYMKKIEETYFNEFKGYINGILF